MYFFFLFSESDLSVDLLDHSCYNGSDKVQDFIWWFPTSGWLSTNNPIIYDIIKSKKGVGVLNITCGTYTCGAQSHRVYQVTNNKQTKDTQPPTFSIFFWKKGGGMSSQENTLCDSAFAWLTMQFYYPFLLLIGYFSIVP